MKDLIWRKDHQYIPIIKIFYNRNPSFANFKMKFQRVRRKPEPDRLNPYLLQDQKD